MLCVEGKIDFDVLHKNSPLRDKHLSEHATVLFQSLLCGQSVARTNPAVAIVRRDPIPMLLGLGEAEKLQTPPLARRRLIASLSNQLLPKNTFQ